MSAALSVTENDRIAKYSTEIVLQGFNAQLDLLDRQEGGGNRPPPANSPDDYGRQSSGGNASQFGGGFDPNDDPDSIPF